MLSRRLLIVGASIVAPAVVLTPGLLMPVRTIASASVSTNLCLQAMRLLTDDILYKRDSPFYGVLRDVRYLIDKADELEACGHKVDDGYPPLAAECRRIEKAINSRRDLYSVAGA